MTFNKTHPARNRQTVAACRINSQDRANPLIFKEIHKTNVNTIISFIKISTTTHPLAIKTSQGKEEVRLLVAP
jgi:hypothetical protein